MELDIQQTKPSVRVTSSFTEQFKAQDLRKLGNIGKISNLVGDIAQCPVSLPEMKLWQLQSKNMQKQISNFSSPVQFYWISLWSNICPGLQMLNTLSFSFIPINVTFLILAYTYFHGNLTFAIHRKFASIKIARFWQINLSQVLCFLFITTETMYFLNLSGLCR